MGLEALDMVRIEAGLMFADYEFSDQTDPFEAGIGFTVPLKSKNDDFIGREALHRSGKEHPRQRLVGLEIDGQRSGRPWRLRAHRSRADRRRHERHPLADPEEEDRACPRRCHPCAIGTAVEIGKLDGQQKRLPARIVRFPHYDPEKTRVRA